VPRVLPVLRDRKVSLALRALRVRRVPLGSVARLVLRALLVRRVLLVLVALRVSLAHRVLRVFADRRVLLDLKVRRGRVGSVA
jgi:hypothetical protein